ncbi:unnamed protein product [Cylicocyclus nassatus]|uniref:Uncharacterized protein n=1 Tax=Cylicocyclus nassatus TaxID=53992 RepID=A0AA36HAI9_CYLNA|nr:unnamed protein product [Cylicocyclus nassatus]
MTSTVRSHKGLVTKKNQIVLAWLEESSQFLQTAQQTNTQHEHSKELALAVSMCDEYPQLLEVSLTKLTEAFDKLEDTTDEDEDRIDKYIETVGETIIRLHAHRSNLKKTLQEDNTGKSTGTEEYAGSQQTEIQRVNDEVLKRFKESIEKREDGYYVRLPWKENHPDLPDNKALALKRLKKVLEIYQKDDEILQAYDNTFTDQLQKGVIEETSENPADCGSRGLTAGALSDHTWWKGPSFINKVDYATLTEIEKDEEVITATMDSIAHISTEQPNDQIIDLTRYSSLEKAQRVLVYALRFIGKSSIHFTEERKTEIQRNIPALKAMSRSQNITGAEMHESRMCIIRDHQKHYVDEHLIKSQKELNIREDEQGVLRCYGRLKKADISLTARTPIYIAPKTALISIYL